MRTVVCLAAALAGALAAADCGRVTGRAIEVIENDLVADDASVRARAATELADRFPDGAVAVPMLVDLLDDESPDVVAAAAKSIDSMALDAAPVLTEFCADRARFEGEKCFGRELEQLLSQWLQDPRDVFGSIDATPPEPLRSDCGSLAALDLVESPRNSRFRHWLAAAVDALGRSSGDTRTMTAAALAMFGEDVLAERRIAPAPDPRRIPAAEALLPILTSNVAVQAYCGARIARRLRGGGPGVVAALAENLSAQKTTPASWKDRRRRFAPEEAADALAAIGPAAAAAAPRLVAIVGDPNMRPDVREDEELLVRCVRALVCIGREADLLPLLDGDSPNALFLAYAAAKGGCAPGLVLHRFVAAAKSSDASSLAFFGLAALGPGAASALPLAQERLRQATDDEQRVARAETVLDIAPDDPEALDTLETILDRGHLESSHGAPSYVHGAWFFQCRLEHAPPRVVRRLVREMQTRTFAFAGHAEIAEALGRAGPAARDAVPALVEQASPSDARRGGRDFLSYRGPPAVVALGRIGPDAASAVPLLTKLRDGSDEMFRVPAAQALRRIRATK